MAEQSRSRAARVELRPLGPDEPDRAESFLQSAFWGRFKSGFGWKALRCALRVEAESGSGDAAERVTEGQILLLERSLGAGFGFAYVPHGPEIEAPAGERGRLLAAIAEAARPLLSRGCLFIRFDPPWLLVGQAPVERRAPPGSRWPADESGSGAWPAPGSRLRRAASDVQSPDTVILDLRPSEEEILAAMKPKWRYNIKLAEKKAVVVDRAGAEALPEFYSMYRETAARDRIAIHPERYYAALFEAARVEAGPVQDRAALPELGLWFARHEGETLASIVTLFHGKRAVYLYGASRDAKRNLMPAYALQWAAMKAARAAGCAEYDLFGIPPSDEPGHPMAGLFRFKTGFGGRVAHRVGSWDYDCRPLACGAFRAAEKLRTWYFKDFRKRGRKTGDR